MKTAGISQIPSIEVQIEKGSTLQDTLKKYVSENPTGNSFTGLDTETAYVKQINDIGAYSRAEDSAFVATMAKLGVESIPDDFQYAGWTYSGEGLTGWGLASDCANQDVTVNFRYTLYYAAGIDKEWRNFDWEFIDAYKALMQKNVEAQSIADNQYAGFTETQKQKLGEKLTAGKRVIESIDNESKGLWGKYIAQKTTSLWGGATSPTEKLKKAADELNDAINKTPTPETVTYKIKRGDTTYDSDKLPQIYQGDVLQIIPTVLPEGAPQDVTYQALGDGCTVDKDGVVTISENATLAMVQVKSVKNPTSASVLIMIKGIVPPTYTATFEAVDGLSFTEKDTLQVAKGKQTFTGVLNEGKFTVRGLTAGEYTYKFVGESITKQGTLIVQDDLTIRLSGKSNSTTMNALMENIAKSYVDKSDDWFVIDMGAYANLNPDTQYKLSSQAKQNYINSAISYLAGTKLKDSDIDKKILGLTAIGGDVTQLYRVNSNTPLNAIEILNGVTQSSSVWSAPYTLAAYNLKNSQTEAYENALVEKMLENQKEDGSWNEWDTVIDTTANAIVGLSFYRDREDVAAAIEKGINFLRTKQTESGVIGDNSNAAAMVIIALASVGINPDTDSRFIKNGNSAIDGLLTFALEDNSGFGYKDNQKVDSLGTEQSFRALIAAAQTMATGKPYNVYDFSQNKVEPVRATGSGGSAQPSEPTGDDITVKFTIKSDTGYWLNNYSVTVKGTGATVYHAFVKACKSAGITYEGAESGYVSSMTKAGKTLAEFTNGKNSGWMYKVNGTLPEVGLTSCSIKNGDDIVWFYTNDWTTVPGAMDFMKSETKPDVTTSGASGSATTTAPTDVKVSEKTNADGTKETVAAVKVDSKHHDEIIKQAAEKKSAEIVLEVSKADSKGADNVQLTLDVTFVKNVADKTNADLTVNTENGKVTLDQETIKTVLGAAKGATITLEVTKVAKPTEAQKKAAGANGHVIRLVIKSGNQIISDFNKGKATVMVELVSRLIGKKVAAIHIADDGTIEQLAGKVLTVGGKQYYEFATPHFSTFAIVDADEVGLDAAEEPAVDAKALASKLTPAARSAKTAKKNVKVTTRLDKQDKEIISQLKDAGYTVKYRFYRSTKKAAGYKAAVTKKASTYTSTSGKKGTKYFYKVQVRVYDASGKLAAKTALKQCRYASRTWSK